MSKLGPTRIMQVCSSLAWGGTEMHVPIVAEKLMHRGHDVQLIAHPKGPLKEEANRRQIPQFPLKIGGYLNPLMTHRIRQFVDRFDPAIIHLHLSRDLWQVVPAVRCARSNAHIVLSKHVGSFVIKKDPLHQLLYHHVSRIITVSQTLNKNVRETCPVEPDRVVTLHPSLDLNLFDPAHYVAADTRKSLGLPEGCRLVGTVGRVSPGKGYEDFLQAARVILDQHPEHGVHFLIIGPASYAEESYYQSVLNTVRELGLEERVHFLGFRRDVPALLSALDVFVFSSRAEGFGATLIEAMAMGVACVSTRSDGTLDTIEDGVTGLVFPSGDTYALARSVITLLSDEEKRSQIAAAGYRQVRELFDLDHMIDRLECLYSEVIRSTAN